MSNKQKKLIVGITAEGSVNLLLGQLAHFKSLGYKTYLLAPYSERSAKFCEDEGCEHLIVDIEREISLWKDIKTQFQIIKFFKVIKPDIVNLGTPKISLLGMIAATLLRVPKRIYTCRGFRFEHEAGLKRKILIAMEKITAFFAHKVICISNSVQNLGIENKIFSNSKSLVINKGSSNGVNLDLFNMTNVNHQLINQIVEKHKLKECFVFGFVGRINDRKGINELYEAFDLIYKSNQQVRLLLVGPFEEEQISNKNLIIQIKNHPGIVFIGRVMQDEVPNYIALMDVFVLPAWSEGFGNVLIQAAAMRKPVVSTRGTGTIDAVSHDFNGILIPVKDTLSLQNALRKLLEDKEIRKKYGENGLLWSQNFRREEIWQELNKIYSNE